MRTTGGKVTQRAIAKAAQIGPDFLYQIIRGRRRCPPPVALRLEEATGISRDIWVWGTPEEMKAAVKEVCNNDLREPYQHRRGSQAGQMQFLDHQTRDQAR